MGMCDNGDSNMLMEFRGQYWDLWEKFVKDNEDYCNETSDHKEYCDCDKCKKVRGY